MAYFGPCLLVAFHRGDSLLERCQNTQSDLQLALSLLLGCADNFWRVDTVAYKRYISDFDGDGDGDSSIDLNARALSFLRKPVTINTLGLVIVVFVFACHLSKASLARAGTFQYRRGRDRCGLA